MRKLRAGGNLLYHLAIDYQEDTMSDTTTKTNRFHKLTDREVDILHQALHAYRRDASLDAARNEEARKLQVELEDSF